MSSTCQLFWVTSVRILSKSASNKTRSYPMTSGNSKDSLNISLQVLNAICHWASCFFSISLTWTVWLTHHHIPTSLFKKNVFPQVIILWCLERHTITCLLCSHILFLFFCAKCKIDEPKTFLWSFVINTQNMLLELPQIWFSFKPERKTFRKFAEVFSEKKSLSQWDIFWEFLRNTNVIFMERFGNIHWYNLVPAPCYVTLTTACIRVVMSGDVLKRRMMKGGKVVEEKREKLFCQIQAFSSTTFSFLP